MNDRLLIGFALIAIITGVNVYNHQEDYSGTAEFNKYGFSLRYPSNAMTWEAGYPDYGSTASDFAGRFQATSISEDELIEQVLVIWTTIPDIQENSTLEDGLLDVIEDITTSSNIKLGNLSEMRPHEIDGYSLLYVYFEGTRMEIRFNSIIGVMILPWESLRSYRCYILGYVSSEGAFSEAELEEKYLDFLGSFEPVS